MPGGWKVTSRGWWTARRGWRAPPTPGHRAERGVSDRSDPDRYVAIVFFDSDESAMQNSSLPETQASADQYRKVADGPPAFHDLIVLDESN